MRLFVSILAAASVALSIVALARAADTRTPAPALISYSVDSVHSTALFRVHHLGAGQFWGRFNDLGGEIVADEQSAPQSVNITIKTESVDTNSEGLDRHLKSPDFFNAREFPEMSFKSTSIESSGEGIYTLTGDLTIRGTTKQITAELEHTGTADMRGKRIGFEARFTVNRSDFGVSYGVDNGALGDETKVIVGLEALAGG